MASLTRESAGRGPRTVVGFPLYRGRVLKSRDGIPRPTWPPPGTDLEAEARTARGRLYPVAITYTAYAMVVIALGVRADGPMAVAFACGGIAAWTLIEYLVHRHILHGRFPDGPGWWQHALHRLFDPSHGDHHLRPWDGRHVNGGLDTLPVAVLLVAASFLGPLPTWPVLMAAVLQCYVIEEWVHYALHFHRCRWRYFEYIRRHHLYHHGARGRDVAFGLTSGMWDVALGTRIPAQDRKCRA
jgi:dihydroceramide fatty acyl 2-hydroxylase